MTRFGMLMRGASVSALLALGTVPAYAGWGKADRAHAEISAAQAKVDAANKIGASGNTPAMIARAQAELNLAKQNVEDGHKDTAIDQAIDAGRLADTAMGEAHQASSNAAASRVADANAQAQQAQQDAADAQADAQQKVADANARAADASASAQSSAASAAAAQENLDAMRNQPPTVVTTTTEKTTSRTPTHRVVHKVVRRPAVSHTAVAERTTTTVTTGSPQ